jgi:hypothetical protein
MRTNYVLIDYENVQPKSLTPLVDIPSIMAMVFVGASQAKIDFAVAESLQSMGDRASYVRISGNGSNALDFHIAYYIGRLAAADPTAYFHIVSKDTGFDPLIAHLRANKLAVCRWADILKIPVIKPVAPKSVDDKLAQVRAVLKRQAVARPRTVKTLTSSVRSTFQKTMAPEEADAMIAELVRRGEIQVVGTKVSYTLGA